MLDYRRDQIPPPDPEYPTLVVWYARLSGTEEWVGPCSSSERAAELVRLQQEANG